jgi:H+/Cl- antiporter ClcA
MKSEQARTYLIALAAAALAGIPVAAAAVLFDSLVHGLTTVFWTDIPKDVLDVGEPPWWYVLLLPTFAGLLTWPVLKLPGKGGHSPADGLSFAPVGPKLAASAILAAFISLVFGIVLGPEAPLTALGLALGAVAGRLATKNQVMASMVALAGGFAAISTVFGGPLASSLLLFEAVATSGQFQSGLLQRILLPGLLAAGIGQLVFTGVAGWSGVNEIALAIPGLPHYGSVRVVDIPITILIAIVTAAFVLGARRLGSLSFHRIGGRLPVLLAGGLGVGLCAVLFHEISGKPLGLVLFSGETGLSGILTQTSAAVVVGCLFAKAIAYALSIGAGFRGGPVFPALFLGVAVGVLMTIAFSGFSITAGVAAGVGGGGAPAAGPPRPPARGRGGGGGGGAGGAAGVAAAAAAALRTPFTGALLGSLIVGSAGTNTVPLAIIAAVVAWLIALAASGSVASQPETPSAPPPDAPSDAPSQAAT